jgi:hypothetical protein
MTATPRARISPNNKAEGKSNRQIAGELGIDETTVRRDLSAANAALASPDNAANAAPLDILLEVPAPRGKREILEAAKKIKAVLKALSKRPKLADLTRRKIVNGWGECQLAA